nr:ATP-binding cassette domain-containing protein [Brevundimonas denitrificans]
MTLDSVAARTPDGTPLFDNLTLAFGHERTGLVGRNGVGKSTLLRLIAGTQPPAEGAVSRTGIIGVLDQRHDPAPGESVAETLGVAHSLTVLRRVLAGEGSVTDLGEADWTLDDRLNDALTQVGLSGIDLNRGTAPPQRRRTDPPASGGPPAGPARPDSTGRAHQPHGRRGPSPDRRGAGAGGRAARWWSAMTATCWAGWIASSNCPAWARPPMAGTGTSTPTERPPSARRPSALSPPQKPTPPARRPTPGAAQKRRPAATGPVAARA